MKNPFLFLLILLFSTGLSAQIIDFPDQNFKTRLLSSKVGTGIAYKCSGGSFKIDANGDGEIDVSEAEEVCSLYLYGGAISDLTGLEYFTNLRQLTVKDNYVTELDLTTLTKLQELHAVNNQLTDIQIDVLEDLTYFDVTKNNLTSIDLSGLPNVIDLNMNYNDVSSFDFNEHPQLRFISVRSNLFTEIDVSGLPNLSDLDCAQMETLETVYMKSGSPWADLRFQNTPNLKYICADARILDSIWSRIDSYGYTNCFANSMCSYVPDQPFSYVFGQALYRQDGEVCQSGDMRFPFMELEISDGENSGRVLLNGAAKYYYALQEGTYTLTPVFDLPDYFTATPSSVTVDFPNEYTELIEDFCIAPSGDHPDLEISYKPIYYYTGSVGIPPEEYAIYQIFYHNKGTMTQSGTVTFNYEGDYAYYISSEPSLSGSGDGVISWEFSDLEPFETRVIDLELKLNSPSEGNYKEEGDLFYTSATITAPEGDEMPEDNVYEMVQDVTNVLLDVPVYSFTDFFKLYPNPTDHYLYLELKKDLEIDKLEIYNINGQKVLQTTNPDEFSSLEVSSFSSGNYFLRLYTEKGIFTTQFIKK